MGWNPVKAIKQVVRHPKKAFNPFDGPSSNLVFDPTGLYDDITGGLRNNAGMPIPNSGPGSVGFDERYYAGPEGNKKDMGTYLTREPGGGAAQGTGKGGFLGGINKGAPPSLGGKGGRNSAAPQRAAPQQNSSPFGSMLNDQISQLAQPQQPAPTANPSLGGKGGGDSPQAGASPLAVPSSAQALQSSALRRPAPNYAGADGQNSYRTPTRRATLSNMNSKSSGGGNE